MTATRPLTNAQRNRIQSFLNACPALYAGRAARGRFSGGGGLDSACGRRLALAPVAGRVREAEIGLLPAGAPDAIRAERPGSGRRAVDYTGERACERAYIEEADPACGRRRDNLCLCAKSRIDRVVFRVCA